MKSKYFQSKEYQVKYDRENPEKYLWKNAKQRARIAGIEFSITVEDITIPDICCITGIRLSKVRTPEDRDCSPSLDRIDNSKGYTKDNICVVSWKANKLKSTLSKEMILKLAEYVS